MPYVWQKNEIVIDRYHGVTVYNTYDDNYEDGGKNEYWFTTNPNGAEDDNDSFDVRELETYDPMLPIARNLTIAIDKGLIDSESFEQNCREKEKGTVDERLPNDDGFLMQSRCPICGYDLSTGGCYTGNTEDVDTYRSYSFMCENCGVEGKEWHALRFDGYSLD